MAFVVGIDDSDITIARADGTPAGGPYDSEAVDREPWPAEAARLRAEAEAKPLKLPVNRRVDERHRALTDDGLAVWYTIQVSPHSRIYDVLFERTGHMPSDDECREWLELLVPDREWVESPSLPGSLDRRFDSFEHDPRAEAPLA
jgi:hypothetical protein